ncbi:MAG: hypothetical protein DIU82_02000 [Bacillota bacterium]|nr:MAG: hypothetical protein DIU82_02000 [Bacillota bacterium]
MEMANYGEVLTFGEVLLRYSTPVGERLHQADRLQVHPAGAELNVAANLVHLGYPARMVTALPDNPLGQLARRRIQAFGVPLVCETASRGRMGVYYYEPGAAPRPGVVTYDRVGSAFSRYPWSQLDWNRVMPKQGVFFTTGITAALSRRCAVGIRLAMETAKQRQNCIAFDVNYRAKLWPVARARSVLLPLLEMVDWLFTSRGDAVTVLGAPDDEPEKLLAWLADRFALRLVTMVYNPPAPEGSALRWRAVAWHEGRFYTHDETAPLETVDRMGAGDAYAAGFLWGMLRTGDVQHALRCGSAMMALKNTFIGDVCPIAADELEQLISGDVLQRAGVRR